MSVYSVLPPTEKSCTQRDMSIDCTLVLPEVGLVVVIVEVAVGLGLGFVVMELPRELVSCEATHAKNPTIPPPHTNTSRPRIPTTHTQVFEPFLAGGCIENLLRRTAPVRVAHRVGSREAASGFD